MKTTLLLGPIATHIVFDAKAGFYFPAMQNLSNDWWDMLSLKASIKAPTKKGVLRLVEKPEDRM